MAGSKAAVCSAMRASTQASSECTALATRVKELSGVVRAVAECIDTSTNGE
jgi:hypothetical protein